jgi:6-phospho-3-hexuloisomerase
MRPLRDIYRLILREIGAALDAVDEEQVDALVAAILSSEQVFLIGVGRVMLVLETFCKRLNHLGVRTCCVGDVSEPAITARDLLIVASGSGESVIPVAIARTATRYKPRIVHIGSNPESSLKPLTDLFVRIPVKTKLKLPGELESAQPMTNLFDQTLYVLCDSVTTMIIERKGLDMESLWRFHANLE